MLVVPLEESRPGMVLAAPVTHPEHPDQDLLKAGYVLEATVIQRMRSLGVAFVYVDYPGLEDLDRHLAVNLSPQRQKLYSQIKQSIVAGQKNTRPAVSYSEYYTTTRDLITTLMCQGQHPVYIENMARMGEDAIGHATSVAHLALLLGIKLEMYLISQRKRLPAHHAKEVVNIGVAGMLHDMGKLQLPQELRKYNGVQLPEKPDELKKMQEHCNLGYESLRSNIEPSAAVAILNHHQHFDGSGFPPTKFQDGTIATQSGEKIHIFARILFAANLYDRVAAPLGMAQRRPNLEVHHLLRTQYSGRCDPTVEKMLQMVCPPFPPGQMVTLSDNTPAVVVDVDQADLYRPFVKRLIGDERKPEEQRLDLRQNGAPTITHVGKTPVGGLLPPAEPKLAFTSKPPVPAKAA